MKVARGSPTINHLFFTDDNIVFFIVNTIEWRVIQKLLDIYETAAGQGINKHKSKIFFSSNTRRVVREQIIDLARVPMCSNQERYLGLPIMFGINKNCTFEYIKDKVWSRIAKWKNTFLYQAGKEVILKSIV